MTEITWYGEAPETARLGVLLLHGRAQNPEVMRELLVDRLALSGVAYAAPRAAGDTWYPAGFLAPAKENEPRLSESIAEIEAAIAELAARGFPREKQVILGFSQGACIGAELVWRSKRRFGALAALTGGLIGPPDARRWPRSEAAATAWAGMPVLLGGSSDDPWVPAFTMRETAEMFVEHGARVQTRMYESNAHEIPDDQIALTRALLLELRDAAPLRQE